MSVFRYSVVNYHDYKVSGSLNKPDASRPQTSKNLLKTISYRNLAVFRAYAVGTHGFGSGQVGLPALQEPGEWKLERSGRSLRAFDCMLESWRTHVHDRPVRLESSAICNQMRSDRTFFWRDQAARVTTAAAGVGIEDLGLGRSVFLLNCASFSQARFTMTVRTRFAPSPTGVLHLGSVRTALFCWLYARHRGGRFVLRIEDTDRQRSTPENVEAITEGMIWLGLDIDEGPFFQSERCDRYRAVIDRWLTDGHAYHCYCTREELDELRAAQMERGDKTRYDGRCRGRSEPRKGVEPVVRFRNPRDGEVFVEDLVRGKVVFKNAELDDLIIARSDGTPTYNFCVIVDDHDMNITHVIRGDDHLNNTPRQMNMLEALGAKPPVYAHLPMILGPDGAKLSKRHGAVDIREYRDQGFLPEAMLNYLVRLGWSHGDQEVFSVDEMIRLFDIADVNQAASSFNPEKLLWLNQQHIIAAPAMRLAEALAPYMDSAGLDPDNGPALEDLADGFRERAQTLVHMVETSRYCFEDFDKVDAKAAKKNLRPAILEPIQSARHALAMLPDWTKAAIARTIEEVAARFELGLGKLGQPIRVAVTGGPVSPPIDATLWLVGRERTLRRLDEAIALIKLRAAEAEG